MSKVTKIDSHGKSEVVIDGIVIRQDAEGRYCLNDFHKAAGSAARHTPNRWYRSDGTAELVEELKRQNWAFNAVETRKGRTGLSFPEFKMTKAQALFVANRFPTYQRERVRSSLGLAESSLVPQQAKETKQQLTATALIDPNVATMTSEQIADLVGSRHTDVKRSIDRLVDRDVIHLPPSAGKEIGGGRPGSMYVFTGEQGKRDSIIVVAQLSPEFTAKLVDRWRELEAHVAKPAPANLSDPAPNTANRLCSMYRASATR